MRLLITGGAGTLGSQIIEHYLGKAEEIFVIDNFSTSKRNIIDKYPEISVIEGTIASEKTLADTFNLAKPTHVIHLAASYKDPTDWKEDIETNVLGTAYVTKLSLKFEIEKLVNIQTVLCYGNPEHLPIEINSPLKPVSSYAISKVAGEQYIINSGINYASLRLGNVISPGLSIGPIPNFYQKLKIGETPTVTQSVRDFLDISDFLSALEKVLNPNSPNGVFNISTGVGTSMLQIFNKVADYLGTAVTPHVVPPAADDIAEIVLDASESNRILVWNPTVPIEQSIQNCLKYYDEEGIDTIYSHLKLKENK